MPRVGKEKERRIPTLHRERQPENLQANSGQNYGGDVDKSQKKILVYTVDCFDPLCYQTSRMIV